jgi:hypothetical protein
MFDIPLRLDTLDELSFVIEYGKTHLEQLRENVQRVFISPQTVFWPHFLTTSLHNVLKASQCAGLGNAPVFRLVGSQDLVSSKSVVALETRCGSP